MTEWLATWLREIILVVLFAVVTDMLLPNNSMQRYIKVVVSLFILLTILNPILTLIRSGDHLREVDVELDRWNSPPAGAQGEMTSTAEIAADAEKLRRVNERQTIEWVEQRLATMVKEDLHNQGYEQVYDVEAQVEMTTSGQADIQELRVMMRGTDDRSQVDAEASNSSVEDHTGQRQLIKPVEPVIIAIDLDEPQQQPPEPSSIGSAVTSEIREHIAEEWGVAPEQIVFRQAAR